jgi:putative MATE family efflux protein
MALAGPFLISLAFQSLYAIIDLVFVRAISDEAVAGLAISFQAFFLMLAISQVVAATALATVSQDYGAGRFERAKGAFTSYTIVALAIGGVAAFVAYCTADFYVSVFTEDPVVHALGVEYFEINSLTFLSQVMFIVFSNSLRATGDFKTPMKLAALSVTINLILDPLLIFGIGPFPEWGLAGAAWATIISQVLAQLLYIRHFAQHSQDPRRLRWTKPLFSRELFYHLLTRGIPAGIQFFLISAVLGIVLSAMKPYGVTWTSTAGGGFRVFQQGLLPLVALAAGAGAMAGQNLGAGHIDRIKLTARTALRWACIYSLLGWAFLHLTGDILGNLFMQDEKDLPIAGLYFAWTAPGLVAFAFILISMYILQACGQSVYPLLAALAKLIVLVIMVYVLIPAFEYGPEWVFAASMVSNFIEGIGGLLFMMLVLRRLSKLSAAPEVKS